MNKRRKPLMLTIPMVLVLMLSLLAVPVSAKSPSPSLDTSKLLSEFQQNRKEASVAGEKASVAGAININQGESIKVSKPEVSKSGMSPMSNFNLNGDLLSYSDSLTTAAPNDWYFFSVPDTRTIILKLQSSNTNYRADLYSINWNTGTATPVGFGYTVGSAPIWAPDLSAGDWGLYVTSSGTVGNTYRIDMNVAAPGGAASIASYTDTLNSVVWNYPNDDLYFNGTYIANIEMVDPANGIRQANPNLDWERSFYVSSGGSYQSRDHQISNARVSYITTRVNYSSDYASSNNAVLIILDKGTLFSYFESQYTSGNPPYYYSSFVDTSGRVTPRQLGDLFEDLVDNPKILVYDLNTNKVIDFVSNLNYYYAMGIEPMPTVAYYN